MGIGYCSSSFAKTYNTFFNSGGTQQSLSIDQDSVVVNIVEKKNKKSILPDASAAHFIQMGLSVVERNSIQSKQQIIGYPVVFHASTNSVGVLTHEIVVETRAANTMKFLKADGYLSQVPSQIIPNLIVVSYSSPIKALEAANALSKSPAVKYAHPNFLLPKNFREIKITEPLFGSQWYLENTGQLGGEKGADISAKGAWGYTKGSPNIIIAVLDAGFEKNHPELAPIWFTNKNEIIRNGIDDDKNGFVDDINGWNFGDNSGNINKGVYTEHGTAVAGLVAARENNKGIIGACPSCTVLPVVVPWTAAKDAEAFYYADKMGADIISNSWGYEIGTPNMDVVVEAINKVAHTGRGGKGTIILFAMNNRNKDDCSGDKPDISSLESVVAISASSDQDKKVSNSAWGHCMEFLAPSAESGRARISSTDMTGNAGYNNSRSSGDFLNQDYTKDFSGTSAATPIAAGVFGLMLSINSDLTRDEAVGLVLSTTDKVHPELANYSLKTGFSLKYGYGRINAEKAVRAAQVFRKYMKKSAQKKAKTI